MDISPTAIKTAREKIWTKLDRVTLIEDNVLTSSWFDTIPDRHFDLAFTRWHLIHIPRSPEKSKYLENLKRISKTFIILEPVSPERTGTIQCQMDGRICHSWDNWGSRLRSQGIPGADLPGEHRGLLLPPVTARDISDPAVNAPRTPGRSLCPRAGRSSGTER